MTAAVVQLVSWLNALANGCGSVLLAPIAVLPGWLSATLVAAATGLGMLLVFKYTSQQDAVRRVRRDIKANLLALSLFHESVVVSLRCQGRIVWGAGRLLSLALVPMAVMIVPMVLLLGQLAAWYQARPLQVGEETVVAVHVAGDPAEDLPDVQLTPCAAIEPLAGPVRVAKQRMMCWSFRAKEPGYHRLTFEAGGQAIEKELAVGNGWMRISPRRPGNRWSDVVLHPCEKPLSADSSLRAIEIGYPERRSWTAGSNTWLVYWFAASMAFAFAARPIVKVDL